MTSFFFVRHGATAHTNHKLSGWMPDLHLTDAGFEQAEAAARSLAEVPLKAVYSSPIIRCLETARPVAAPHALRVRTRRDIGEVDYGKWTNRSLRVLARTKLWSKVQSWPAGARFPDGEALREVQVRAVRATEELRATHPRGPVCIVSHGDVIRLVAAHYMGVHIDLFQRLAVGPGSITVIAIGDSGPHLVTLNSPPGVVLKHE